MNDKRVKKLIKQYWKVFFAAIIVVVIAVIGAVSVFVWHIQTSDIGLQGAATISEWSMISALSFIISLLLWELLFVGLPAIIILCGGGYLWWNNLSFKQQREFKKEQRTQRGHHARKGGAGGFVTFIAFIIYLAIEGNLATPFGDLPYSYWVFAYLSSIAWLLIIAGIPGVIISLLYFKQWYNKK
ncbi:MAG: hypothetical protein WC307_02925 [Candidatus Nanoarchaeia archaeon]|jgi:ABC-type multidrug transport system fused ATPase/permease subunit